jgi:hypothetical protein
MGRRKLIPQGWEFVTRWQNHAVFIEFVDYYDDLAVNLVLKRRDHRAGTTTWAGWLDAA